MVKPILKSKGDYIGGAFLKGPKAEKHINISPADLNDQVFEWSSYAEHVTKSSESARKAYPFWSHLKQKERNHLLLSLADIYKTKSEEIALLISRETGKPLWESRQEAKALSQKVKITLKSALPLVKNSPWASFQKGIREKVTYRSKGVFLVLGPFNFPAHLPNGHIIPALATGNTVIFKPSEKTPAVAEKLAECFDLAGFPKGVFNLVQGGAKTAKALVQSPLVNGILFTGSYSVGKKIQKMVLNQTGLEKGVALETFSSLKESVKHDVSNQSRINHGKKILALEMGGKNSTLVWKDADINKAVEEVFKGAYLTCGQRCSATSRVFLHKKIKKLFLKKFIDKTQDIKIGHWKEDPFMGPLIEKKAIQRYRRAIKLAQKEKALFHLKGQTLNHLNGWYVSPSIVEPTRFNPSSYYQNEELFSPFVTVYSVSEIEEAIEHINQSGYGLCFSVFSKSKALVQRLLQETQVGVFHWNLSTNGASSHLPFGGLGKSGNDRPAGLFAVHSCVTPVAYRELKNS